MVLIGNLNLHRTRYIQFIKMIVEMIFIIRLISLVEVQSK
jgi:hypothetical protein